MLDKKDLCPICKGKTTIEIKRICHPSSAEEHIIFKCWGKCRAEILFKDYTWGISDRALKIKYRKIFNNRQTLAIPPELQIMTYKGNRCTVREAILKAYQDGLSGECSIDLLSQLKVCEDLTEIKDLVFRILKDMGRNRVENAK